MGRWSIISILTITQIFFLFSFWIRDYNIMIDQRIFFIEIKITKNDKFNGHVSEEKKKEKTWKVERNEKRIKRKEERGMEVRSKLLKRGRHLTDRFIFIGSCEIYTCSIAIVIYIYKT